MLDTLCGLDISLKNKLKNKDSEVDFKYISKLVFLCFLSKYFKSHMDFRELSSFHIENLRKAEHPLRTWKEI